MKHTGVVIGLAFVSCLGLTACAERAEQEGAAAQPAAMDVEALTAEASRVEAAWKAGYDAGDAVAVAALYAEDAVYLAPYAGVTRGRAAVETQLAESMGLMSSRQVTITRTDLGGSGDVSYAIGTYTVEMTMGDEPMTDNGKYVTLMKRDAGGSWKISAHIWNTSLSQAEVAQMLARMAAATQTPGM